jgi:DNA repair protein RecO (recombination protein O)
MRLQKAEGIVLKRKNIGESDRLLTVFTKESGKLLIKATGVRKITSRRSSHIEPLNHIMFMMHKGNKTPILTEVETITHYDAIKKDLRKIGLAYHICEIIDGLCAEGQENGSIFILLKKILSDIEQGGNVMQDMYDFEMDLLHQLGFYPKTETDKNFNPSYYIESLLERKLKARPLLHKFYQ